MTTSSIGATAWQTYQDIERVVTAKYRLTAPGQAFRHSDVSMALQRLGEAVILRYGLKEKVPNNWIMKLEEESTKCLSLSTTEQMLNVRIRQFEEATESTPDIMIGHDSWISGTDGRAAGYWSRPSLQHALNNRYYEIKIVVDTPFDYTLKGYQQINTAAKVEVVRLRNKSSNDKADKIEEALYRLNCAFLCKYPSSSNNKALIKEVPRYLDEVDLHTPDAMLDAKLTEGKLESLRDALNRQSLWDYLLGKTPLAIQNVEESLKKLKL